MPCPAGTLTQAARARDWISTWGRMPAGSVERLGPEERRASEGRRCGRFVLIPRHTRAERQLARRRTRLEFELDDVTAGRPVHCEMPNFSHFFNSPWTAELASARHVMARLLQNSISQDGLKRRGNFCVTVQGPGFWDLRAHSGDLQPELHPIERAEGDMSRRPG
jgi:hypothetical protein